MLRRGGKPDKHRTSEVRRTKLGSFVFRTVTTIFLPFISLASNQKIVNISLARLFFFIMVYCASVIGLLKMTGHVEEEPNFGTSVQF